MKLLKKTACAVLALTLALSLAACGKKAEEAPVQEAPEAPAEEPVTTRVAALKGRTLRQRARALIEIAHPDFRDALKEEYERRFHCAY